MGRIYFPFPISIFFSNMKLKPNISRNSLRKSHYNYWWVPPWRSMKRGCPLKAIQIYLVLPSRDFPVNKPAIFLNKRSKMISNDLCWAQWMGRPYLILADKGVDLQVFDLLQAVLQRYACADHAPAEDEFGLCLVHPLLKWNWWKAALLSWCSAIQRCRRWYFTAEDAWTSHPHLHQDMAASWMQIPAGKIWVGKHRVGCPDLADGPLKCELALGSGPRSDRNLLFCTAKTISLGIWSIYTSQSLLGLLLVVGGVDSGFGFLYNLVLLLRKAWGRCIWMYRTPWE